MSWFNCKVSYEKSMPIGNNVTTKKVSESYLVEADDFTEVKAIVAKKLMNRGGYVVDHIRKVRLYDVFSQRNAERWYEDGRIRYRELYKNDKYVDDLTDDVRFRRGGDELKKREGFCEDWYENGRKLIVSFYRKGEIVAIDKEALSLAKEESKRKEVVKPNKARKRQI